MSSRNGNSSHKNLEVAAAFIRQPQLGGGVDFAECKYCGRKRTWNTSDFCAKHLLKYTKYLQYCDDKEKNRTSQPKITSAYKTDIDLNLDELFAEAVFTSTANFTLFQTNE